MPALLNPCCFGALPFDQSGVSWASNSDIDLVWLLDSDFKGFPNRDRVSRYRVEIETVEHAGYQKVQAITCDHPPGADTAT